MTEDANAIKLVPPETEPAAPPVQPEPETADQARLRASKCWREVIAVLLRYRCRIGQEATVNKWYSDGQLMVQTSMTYGVIPE